MSDRAGVPPQVRAVAFDWGGIFTEGTFDSDAVRNLAALCGVSEARIEATYFPLMAEFEAGSYGLDEFVTRFRQRSALEFGDEDFRRTFLASGRERPAMHRLLAEIPDELRVAVLSNNVAVLCDRVRDDSRMTRVERFLFSNEIGVRKPDAEAFLRLREALALPPEETVFIDDNAENVRAARELGFRGVHFSDFRSFVAELRELLPGLPPLQDSHA